MKSYVYNLNMSLWKVIIALDISQLSDMDQKELEAICIDIISSHPKEVLCTVQIIYMELSVNLLHNYVHLNACMYCRCRKLYLGRNQFWIS